MTLKAVLLSMILIGGVTTVAFADDRGSDADQQACMPDVRRLCDQFIPDEAQIVGCLKKELKHLSPACKKVVARTM